MMFEVISVIFIISSALLSVLVYRGLSRIAYYEESFDDIYSRLLVFSESIGVILDREIYSNEPVIIELVEQMKNMQHFVSHLSDNYRFNELAENKEDETA